LNVYDIQKPDCGSGQAFFIFFKKMIRLIGYSVFGCVIM